MLPATARLRGPPRRAVASGTPKLWDASPAPGGPASGARRHAPAAPVSLHPRPAWRMSMVRGGAGLGSPTWQVTDPSRLEEHLVMGKLVQWWQDDRGALLAT